MWLAPLVDVRLTVGELLFSSIVVVLFALTLWYLTARPSPLQRKRQSVSASQHTLSAYVALAKPRIIPLLLVPTAAAMLMAERLQPLPFTSFVRIFAFTLFGGALAAMGAHVFNSYVDRDIDAAMRRTRSRPFPSGQVNPERALLFGALLTVSATLLLALTVNFLAAGLALAGNLFYVLVYSIWLKRRTPQNIVIGGAAGAVPPLVGWAAVTHQIGLPAVLLFAIIYFWTPAHFWALALVREEDYRAAGVPMLPIVRGRDSTYRGILEYTLLLVLATIALFLTRSMGLVYMLTASVLGIGFLLKSFQLMRKPSTALAWSLFKYSNVYLALLYCAMVVDRLTSH
ncbi:MAG: heme o synthase [Chloroflexi bacterium]|nr:heme o synthase [Chloroflexota bacterium]